MAFFFSNRTFSKLAEREDEGMLFSSSVLICVYPRSSAASELRDFGGGLFRGQAAQGSILGHRLLRVFVIVEAFARLAPVPARQHHAFEQRRRSKTPLLELLEHYVGYVVGGVEPDKIQQREWPHGV